MNVTILFRFFPLAGKIFRLNTVFDPKMNWRKE